jgi:translocation and assembly module TamA
LLASLAALALAAVALPDARAADGEPPARVAYRVVVDAPGDLRTTLEQGLDLVRWQGFADMTGDLLDRLVREAIEQAKAAAATAGYFSAAVDVAVERGTTPDAPLTLTLTVRPGEPTRVTSVRVRVTGAAATDAPVGTAAIASAQREWLLPVGEVFRQSAWDAAKRRAVATIAASPYAAARLERSEARIDPDAHSAALDVEIASGEPYRFGRLDVRGLSRHPLSVVRNFSTLATGDRYSEAELEQFVRRLNGSGYFASVQARLDTDAAQDGEAPVDVRVIEAPTRRVEAGLFFSTDTKFRANLRYSDVDVDREALQFHADGRADTSIQSLTVRLVRPPTDRGWLDALVAQIEHTDISGLVTQTGALGVRRRSLDERDVVAYAATFYDDRQAPSGAPRQHAYATYLEVGRTWRDVDDLLAPARGWVLDAALGGGPPGVSTKGFGRGVVKFATWLPLGRDVALQFRAEAGGVLASSRNDIPSALLFRTGGDTTVRGYAFESLGVQQGEATVGGRYYALASVEATHWVTPTWGVAAFADAGNATDDLGGFRLRQGYGLGLRVRSPLGPVRVDVAYGQETAQVRLHMSVGLSF